MDTEREWRTAGGKPVANEDSWQALLKRLRELEKKAVMCSFGRFLGNGVRRISMRRRRLILRMRNGMRKQSWKNSSHKKF